MTRTQLQNALFDIDGGLLEEALNRALRAGSGGRRKNKARMIWMRALIAAAVVAVIAAAAAVTAALKSPESETPQTASSYENAEDADLSFSLNKDGSSYSLTSVNHIENGRLILPAEYKGLPVTGVSKTLKSAEEVREVVLSKNIKELDLEAFMEIGEIRSIIVEEGNENFCVKQNCLIDLKKGQVLKGFADSVIPTDPEIRSIADSAFKNCLELTDLYIPDNIEFIGNSAFSGCVRLKTVRFSENLVSVRRDVFRGCSSLVSVTLPAGLQSVYDGAFADCLSLKTLRTGEWLLSVGASAFEGCTALTTVYFESKLFAIGENAFKNCPGLQTVRYNGPEEDWNKVIVGEGNEAIANAHRLYREND